MLYNLILISIIILAYKILSILFDFEFFDLNTSKAMIQNLQVCKNLQNENHQIHC